MLTVLQVAYPLAPVGLDATGGAEQVMALLDRGLISRGHRSIAIACAGSDTAGTVLEFPVHPPFDENAKRAAQQETRQLIASVLQQIDVDLLHFHGVDFFEYMPPEGVPALITLHLPASFYPDWIFPFPRANTFLNCVSGAHLRSFSRTGTIVGAVENGIPLALFPDVAAPKENYAIALGRICPEKGFHLALDAAEKAGVPLWLAGAVFPYAEHEDYFRRELEPRLRPPHRFLGSVGFHEKIRLLSKAHCLLLPSMVPESSSLVAMEAMACGTPVVTFGTGAPAEMVEHGVTGFVVGDVEEMARGVRNCRELDSVHCRRRARARFSAERMVDRYLSLYDRIVRDAQTEPALA